MKKLPIIFACFCLVLSMAAFSVPAAAQAPRPAMVKTTKAVQETTAATVEMTGTLYFDRTSRVSPEESARITAVAFREGERIEKGAVLIRLDRRILEKQLALEKARLKQVDIRIQNARRNLERLRHLFKTSAASESALDDQKFAHEALLQEKIALERQVDILAIRMEKYVVRAPFDGIVLKKQAEIGEWVSPGSILCVLAASDALYVEVPVGEHLVRFNQTNDEFPVTLNAFGRELTATMEGIRPQADPRTKNVSLKLHLPYTGPVAENMSATVRVRTTDPQPMIMLSRDALVQVRGTDMVYTIREKKAVPLPIRVLYAKGRRIGVAAQGLEPGMDVVVEGNERLRPGQAVMVLNHAPAASGDQSGQPPAPSAKAEPDKASQPAQGE